MLRSAENIAGRGGRQDSWHMKRTLKAYARSWPMTEPFVIARGTQTTADLVVVELAAGNVTGRGEAAGVPYAGETHESLDRKSTRLNSSHKCAYSLPSSD